MALHRFQRRHYIAIAQGVSSSLYEIQDKYQNSEKQVAFDAAQMVASALAVQFYHDNSKFNRSRFMIACGLQSGPSGLKKGAKK